jgi:hypothetical protein
MQQLLRMRAAGFKFTAEELAERLGPPEARTGSDATRTRADRRHSRLGSDRPSRERAPRRQQRGRHVDGSPWGADQQAVADPAVTAIVLDVNSPGGGVFGLPEVAETIRSGRVKETDHRRDATP